MGCPKCGTWKAPSGPHYDRNAGGFGGECLRYRCRECGFSYTAPTADEKPINIASDDMNLNTGAKSGFAIRPEDAVDWSRPKPGERGFQPGCGCCAGPVDDRCCCHFHCDLPRGLHPHKCSLHK